MRLISKERHGKDYYCCQVGETVIRQKTRGSAERRLQLLLSECPGAPARLFTQTYAMDAEGAPTTLLGEETLMLYNGYTEDAPPPKPAKATHRKAEW